MLRAAIFAVAFLPLFPSLLLALPTEVVHADVPNCDVLFVPQLVDELGLPGVFPLDELIDATSTFVPDAACPGSDDPAMINSLVVMTNLSPTAWRDVWYVADPFSPDPAVGTSISNFDGFVDGAAALVNPGEAFKIDTIGVNRPLVFESGLADGIFSPGETWHFIIDDYINSAGLPASLFDSRGVGSLSAGGTPSSGSIIAVPVPEPATFLLLFVGGAGFALFARIGTRATRRHKTN